MWTHRHLLGIEQLSANDIELVLKHAGQHLPFVQGPDKKSVLAGHVVANPFFEASTRTRSSFEIAAKKLGADVLNFTPSNSSVTKGENALSTVQTLEAMHVRVFVVRHEASGVPHFLAARSRASILNAGDGMHEHPTQALLDAMTILRHKGTLAGLSVAICGDILHSRVARSNTLLLERMGAHVRLCGPKTLLARGMESLGKNVRVFHRLEEAVEGADVVMMLRLQQERFQEARIATRAEYSRTFGLHPGVLKLAQHDAIVMHPGPINLGVELGPALAEGAQSVVLEQVEAGVAVRMAVLELLCQTATDAARGQSNQELKSANHDLPHC